MANFYGSAVNSTGNPAQSTNPAGDSAGFSHARLRRTYSVYSNATPYVAITNDVLVFGLFKPSDRIIDIKFFCDGAGTNGALNIGVHQVNRSNGELSLTAIDADLFASARATGTAVLHGAAAATVFTEAGTLSDSDRGKALWKLADIGGGTFTADPGGIWAITGVFTVIEDATSVYRVEIEYVAGD